MTALHSLKAEPLASPPDHSEAVASLRSGQEFTCVLAEDPRLRSAAIEAAILAVADMSTRFVRAGNPLRSPLTIERLLIQVTGPAAIRGGERDAAALTRLVAGPQADESRVIVVVEDADTLDAEAIRILRLMSRTFRASRPTVQVLFSGHPAFRAVLAGEAPSAPALPEAPPAQAFPGGPAPAMPQPAPVGPSFAPEADRPLAAKPPQRSAWPIRLLVPSAILAGAVAGACWLAYPGAFRGSAPPPARTVPPPSPAPPLVSAAPEPEPARLRAEFEQFLAASGQTAARLNEPQREALLKEFMAWRARSRSPGPQH